MNNVSLPREELIETMISKYGNTIYRVAFTMVKNSYDAQDIVQDVFIKYFKNKIEFLTEEHRKAWILRVTINTSKNLLTSAWFRRTTALEDNLSTIMEEDSEVYKYVLKLPSKYRSVIHLFYYEDLQVAEIANILNRKETTVKSQLHRARAILKQNMEGDNLIEF